MGELRTSLLNAATLAKNVEKSLTSQMAKLDGISKDANEWRKSGFKAIDEFCLYMLEKLKKKNLEFRNVKESRIRDYSDSNVANYLRGVQFTINAACDYSERLEAIVGDRGFGNDLAGLDDALAGAAAQIRKKKKKLLQSKKYKAKIATYEGALSDLQSKVAGVKKRLQDLRDATPKPERIRQQLGVTEDTTLKDLIKILDFSKAEQYRKYNSLLLDLNESVAQIRENAEFAGHMKVIKDIVAEAEELEAQ